MKTLVIHPDDRSTDFLKVIYKDLPNKTVVVGGKTLEEINSLIESHDRVIMLGHGSPSGLFALGLFPGMSGYVIGRAQAELLAKKDNNMFVWCYASDFVQEHNLKGFSSGMFISEVGEAMWCGIPRQTQEQVDEQNNFFCESVSKVVAKPAADIYDYVTEHYGNLAKTNLIAEYNLDRLRYFN